MMLKSLKHAGWPALLACVAVAACSKKPAVEDAFVLVTVGPSDAFPGLCSNVSSTSTFFAAGQTNSSTLPTTVTDGEDSVTINCSVSPNNGGYDINVSASLPGAQGGVFNVYGHTNAGGSNTGLSGTFYGPGGQFTAKNNCTLTYMYENDPIAANQQISAGEIFAHISCPDAIDQGGEQVLTGDGGSSEETCDAEADFLFENCTD
jgi:hypothetical protein